MKSIIAVCTKCGITKKSGKMSCCGHGGSWFGNCGSAGDTKFDHTWYEGLQACNTRPEFNTAIGQHLNRQQQKHEWPNSAGNANYKGFIVTTKQFAFASAPVLRELPIIAPVNTPANICLLYTSPSPRDYAASRMPSSA